jgi:hypothetical protein
MTHPLAHPVVPSFTHHTVGIPQVVQILQGAQSRGLDVAVLLRRAGIAPALLDSPLARVTQAQYAALILILRRSLRDELWGLCSQPLKPGGFVHCCRQLIHCSTLGEALRVGFAYYHLLLSDFAPRLQISNGVVRARSRPLHCQTRPTPARASTPSGLSSSLPTAWRAGWWRGAFRCNR